VPDRSTPSAIRPCSRSCRSCCVCWEKGEKGRRERRGRPTAGAAEHRATELAYPIWSVETQAPLREAGSEGVTAPEGVSR
jgi:hypothetical protein